MCEKIMNKDVHYGIICDNENKKLGDLIWVNPYMIYQKLEKSE